VLQVRSDRHTIRPYGLYGGDPGQPSRNLLTRDGRSEALQSKFTMNIRRGDVFRHELAGGGGWGDPLARDPLAVLRDVRNEMLSADKARSDYGVIVDTQAWRVDQDASRRLRERMREARGGELPAVSWHDRTPARAAE
jgi:N-methylhydantoinase B